MTDKISRYDNVMTKIADGVRGLRTEVLKCTSTSAMLCLETRGGNDDLGRSNEAGG